MVKQLHYFNPGHEIALFQGKGHFTPPGNVLKMMHDLACIPLWYAEDGDFVLVEESIKIYIDSIPKSICPYVIPVTSTLLKEKSSLIPELQATPWGISPHSLQRMSKLQKETGICLDVPAWDEEYYKLAGRQTAANCLASLREWLPDIVLPEVPVFFSSVDELEEYLHKQTGSCLIKTPYSSSGRGLLWLAGNSLTKKEKEWITGSIRKQGSVSLEPALNKQRDFGWEFLSDGKGGIVYRGVSPFTTNSKGSFLGNSIYAQDKILREIYQMLNPKEYNRILDAITGILQKMYSYIYKGCIGVDILIYQSGTGGYHLHPCVEINMRYTMGYLSLQLEKIIHPESKGIFRVTYDKGTLTCYQTHQEMQRLNPLSLSNGKIRKGYLSLCPVTSKTNYKAFITVEEKF
ncbi:MAG: hypothetical protein LIP01_01080 [Tannerellaceae bacterium]|nr:hypothetical protein [Tannerellaceae bacterium]